METGKSNINLQELMVKYLAGETNAHERAEVEVWIDASTENRKYYEHFKLLWDESQKLAHTGAVDEDQAWGRLRERMHQEYIGKPQSKYNTHWWLVAALIVLVSAAILWVPYFLSTYGGGRDAIVTLGSQPGNLVSLIANNSTQTHTLADGTVITLNKHSELSYPAGFTSQIRSVELKGEAFFNVKHDAARPFVIKVDNLLITVLGTSFNVNNRGNKTEVVVESGVVSVSRQQELVRLNAGEELIVVNPGISLKKQKNIDSLYRFYLDKEVHGKSIRLGRIVEKLNETYNARIIITDPNVNDARMNLTLNRDETLDRILTLLCTALHLSAEHKPDGSILLNKDSGQNADSAFDINKHPDLLKKILKDPAKWAALLKNYVPRSNDIAFRRAAIHSVIDGMQKENIVPAVGVRSFRLNEHELIINDVRQPDAVQQRFKAKFIKEPGYTIYLGGAPRNGKGVFLSRDSL